MQQLNVFTSANHSVHFGVALLFQESVRGSLKINLTKTITLSYKVTSQQKVWAGRVSRSRLPWSCKDNEDKTVASTL